MENKIEDIVGSVMKNPELLDKISSSIKENGGDMSKSLEDVISLLSSGIETESKDSPKTDDENVTNEGRNEGATNTAQLFDLLSSFGKGNGASFTDGIGRMLNKSAPLLIALKPFLSKPRCELIDTLIKISKLTSIVNLAR